MLRRLLILATVLAGLAAVPAHAGVAKATAWCGTLAPADRPQTVLAGDAVHVVYAIPSDGADRSAQWAPVIQSDAEQIDGWWRGQDSTRALRFDLFQFPCGGQLDLTLAHLPESGAQLAPSESRASGILQSLTRLGLISPFFKTLVYYDGPWSGDEYCGQGGGDPQGAAIAIVYVTACAGVPSAPVAAHEVIHSLGAVDDSAPHNCPPPNAHHTCDTQTDIMYPFADGSALSALLLDPARDDYYGHSGSWWDVQDSPWLVQLDRQVQLGVTVTGPGTVTSNVPGVDCTATCTTSWNSGTVVTVTPTPAQGNRFVRWSGGCVGVAPCPLTLSQATNVGALFAPATFGLTLAVAGRGTIRASPAGVACSSRCTKAVAAFEQETLRATAAKGWRLMGWSGACHGKAPTCSVPMSAATTARAQFVRAPAKKK